MRLWMISYNALLYLFFPWLLVYFIYRCLKERCYRLRWYERLGWMSVSQVDVLCHCSSVGEAQALLPLIQELWKTNPELKVCVTTSSYAGSVWVQKHLSSRVTHCYLPFDFYGATQRFIQRLNPRLCLLMETELWPNLLYFLEASGCKVLLCNARMSNKSFISYQKVPYIQTLFSRLTAVMSQTEVEAQRFIQLGTSAETCYVTGSLKYEIDIILTAHQQLLKQRPNALLICVPRHARRFHRVYQQICQRDLQVARYSLGETVSKQTQVLLGDSIGDLLMWYGASDIAFVGGSLIDYGGHNPLEAAAQEVGVLMGASTYNFDEICHQLQHHGHLFYVHDARSLTLELESCFEEQDRLRQRGKAGLQVFKDHQGACSKHIQVIQQILT